MSSTQTTPPKAKRRLAAAAAILLGGGLLATAVTIVLTTAPGHGRQPVEGPRFTASDHPAFAAAGRRDAPAVSVHVGDYWFALGEQRVPAGTVTLNVRNVGATVHDVMIERLPIKLSAPGVPVDEAAQGGVDGLEPGTSRTTTVVLRPGRYAIFCSVPGHFQAGQHGELAVTGQAAGAKA